MTDTDYGELLLFLLLKVFYGTDRLVTKVKLRSSVQDQIKGFDCAHFSVDEYGEISLWLGEVKFYKSFGNAASDIAKEISQHLEYSYLKDEFSILCPNIEYNNNVQIPDQVVEYLDGTASLDDVKIVIPALVTYESSLVRNHQEADGNFENAIKNEFEKKFDIIDNKNILCNNNIEIFFIILPLEDVDWIKSKIDAFEEAYR